MYITRNLGHRLLSAAENFPALVLTGARQTGKTTLLRKLFPKHGYVSLDRPLLAEQAERDPELFLKENAAPLIIDEVQYAPSLFRYLKIKIDAHRDLKGQYLLTGSQKFTLMKEVSESLAGRIAVFELEGLSVVELKQHQLVDNLDLQSLSQLLSKGGFPELWSGENQTPELFLHSYISAYLERDVRQILAVNNLRDFERFMRAIAMRTGQQLNKSDLARDIGISVPTVGEWLGVLAALGQVILLEPWFANLGKRLTKSPKVYLADPALCCFLLGIGSDIIPSSPFVGAIWETFVFAELRKQSAFKNKGASNRIWYFRHQNQTEVDFVVEHGHELTMIECKWTSEPSRNMLGSIHKVEKLLRTANSPYQVKRKILVSRADQHIRYEDGAEICSVLNLNEVV